MGFFVYSIIWYYIVLYSIMCESHIITFISFIYIIVCLKIPMIWWLKSQDVIILMVIIKESLHTK